MTEDQKTLKRLNDIKEYQNAEEFKKDLKIVSDLMKKHVNGHQGSNEVVKEDQF
jgi:hypothetical protein